MSTGFNEGETTTVTAEGVTVEISGEFRDETAMVRFDIDSRLPDSATVRLIDRLPTSVAAGQVRFHPEYRADCWTDRGREVVFEDEIDPQESAVTVYAVEDATGQTMRRLVESEPRLMVDPGPSASLDADLGASPGVTAADVLEDPDWTDSGRGEGERRAEWQRDWNAFGQEGVGEEQVHAVDVPDADGRLSTGVNALDQLLEGGIPPGRIVALVAPPEAQSGLLVDALVSERPTVYVSTVRSYHTLVDDLERQGIAEDVTVEHVSPDVLLEAPAQYVGQLGGRSNLVIDPVDSIELLDRTRYITFMNKVRRQLAATGSVAMVRCLDGDDAPDNRTVTLTLADIVWRLRLEVDSPSVETPLVVSKFRGGRALTDVVKLELTDSIDVDTSRDIA